MAKRTKSPTVATAAHPLDIPDFLRREKGSVRDEAAVQAVCARAALMHQPLDAEDHDPRLVDMARRGLISRSVLRDPQSIAIALNTLLPRAERAPRSAGELVGDAQRVERRKRPEGGVDASALAATLEITPRLLRHALRTLKVAKPDGGWVFPQAEADAIAKKIKAWLKKEKAR